MFVRFHHHWFEVAVIVALAVAASTATADAYLDALNDAADDVELDPNSKQATQQAGNARVVVSADGRMPSGMTLVDFEAFLQRRYLGSHAFFQKLTPARKTQVFRAYENKPEIDYVRDQIKRQYLSQ